MTASLVRQVVQKSNSKPAQNQSLYMSCYVQMQLNFFHRNFQIYFFPLFGSLFFNCICKIMRLNLSPWSQRISRCLRFWVPKCKSLRKLSSSVCFQLALPSEAFQAVFKAEAFLHTLLTLPSTVELLPVKVRPHSSIPSSEKPLLHPPHPPPRVILHLFNVSSQPLWWYFTCLF